MILPIAYREAIDLSNTLPVYADRLWEMFSPYIGALQTHFVEGDAQALQEIVRENIGKAVSVGSGMVYGIGMGGQAVMSFFSIMVLTPLVAFFMMIEWDVITAWLDKQIPRHNYKVIKDLLSEIDRKISGFVRGQITIAFFLSIIYATALTIAGLNFGFLIGFIAGLLSVIPMLGSSLGLIFSLGVAWFQSGEISYVGIIAAIFIIGQLLEGNILTPRILGKSVGLHPLWILFSIMAGAAAFGIVGMLLAVPVVASAGVLTGFFLNQYRQSAYYKDKKKASYTGKNKGKSKTGGKAVKKAT
jgi:predicted PurR-regulated permease PerM